MAFFCKPSTTPQLHSSIFFFLINTLSLILLLPNTTNSVSFNIPDFQQNNGGRQTNARVRCNATTRKLTVYLTPIENPDFSDKSTLYLDLSKVLPEQITVGFGCGIQSLKVISWQFHSSLQVGKSASIRLVVGLVIGIGGTCALIFISFFIWLTMRRGNKQNNDERTNSEVSMDSEFENGTGPKRFSYTQLVHATNNFDEGGKLGQGGFGGVYKGFLSDLSLNVAVRGSPEDPNKGRKNTSRK